MAEPCEKCGGRGTLTYRIAYSGSRALGDGTIIEDLGGSGTHACECVRDLPAINGRATWWESEVIHRQVVSVPIGNEAVEVSAICEVPRDDKGRRVHRTAENAYYPPLVEVESPERVVLHSDYARQYAAALIAAADACDKADELAAGHGGDA